MRGMIYAVSPEGVIGREGTIPWRYPGDLRRFKRVTLGSTVVMGRTTFESIGKPLPGRRNIVLTSRPLDAPGIETAKDLGDALAKIDGGDVWFIGGARVYREAMPFVDIIDVTYVPDRVPTLGAVLAPPINERVFSAGPLLVHEEDPGLTRRVYTRREG
jgi:dihydrofolate reductase